MTETPFVVSGVRLTHRDASVADLEAATHPDPVERMEELAARGPVSEAFVLQTCNRVEEYVVTPAAPAGEAMLEGGLADGAAAVHMDHTGSLRHLLRVAAGLESQVLGEDEILGQVRDAYDAASDAGTLGPVLEEGLLKAIHVGERARAETDINEGTVSLGSAAVDLAREQAALGDATAVVVGAGRMARTVARSLGDAGVTELRVVNRSSDRAADLAADLEVPARPDGLAALPEHLSAADVAVSTTGSEAPLIDRPVAEAAGEAVLIDLAQPRDVAPEVAEVTGVTVFDLDGLEAVTEATHESRRAAAEAVEAMVEDEFERLLDQYKRKRADAVISAMYQGAERVKQRELATATEKLGDLSPEEREVIEGMADALVSKLLSAPTESLREAAANDDWETIDTALQLFDPTFEGADDPPTAAALLGREGPPDRDGPPADAGGE